ncbi:MULTISPECIES: ABC transporter substrate-binding protein [Paraburkholderia]|uniref:Carbohydrate ABC transporter substrate-binding protein, CUT1 family n=1 Tax=Paraburkholderia aspalathi TaxID=1324617 RepID=A0A1I7DCX9_9BURK|nr:MULTISPECIES: extracellular solute-binding protein [Paraburkholderia]MCP2090103.1 multiple sugar transport system substrate-binding protein [Paraburkholderia sediminicola]MBK3820931.1 extracellular solute-binding protein [Paraburkholderia aspalathi]MBK3832720.1 extracellular solute-binding protein [Paraburkholderia aspalathi]MBK3862488.1 extracellular solute-binding protein [Paraburkholderia aspalathi]MCX4158288.1 extracellular solute-binding protein [Paraburkholderia aspalathi]
MTKQELLTIISFAEKARALSNECLGINEATWDILLFVIRRHLENKLVTVTSLAHAANMPYSTAVRKIDQMLEEELIIKRERTTTGKSFSLHPSEDMIARFHDYALRMKDIVAQTFGFPTDAEGRSSYYFGASYMAANIISGPAILRQGIGVKNTMRFLFTDDPTFLILARAQKELEQWLGGKVEITCASIDDVRTLTLNDAQRAVSHYDIIDFDMPQIGEYAQKGVLMPIDALLESSNMNPSDFHPASWNAASYDGVRYGVPIEPTAELFFYRTDIFESLGLAPPTTVDETLHALRLLKKRRPDIAGVAFCAARGTPIGHTFLQLLGDFGRSPLDLPVIDGDFDLSQLSGERIACMIDSPEGLATAEYLLALQNFAPPNLLHLAWDDVGQLYAEGKIATGYVWSVRAARFEFDSGSPAHKRSGFLPHPRAVGTQCISPMGGYALGIPRNIDPKRVDMAWRVTQYLTSPELIKYYVQNGCLVSPRFSVSADPEVKGMSGVIEIIDRLAQNDQLKYWQRPPIPEFSGMTSILGEEIHRMMRGEIKPKEALVRSQQRIDRILQARES